MGLEIHELMFPRHAYSPPEAAAWASLHGFDHAMVRVEPTRIVVEHRPRGIFDPGTLHRVLLEPETRIGAVVGRVVRRSTPASERLTYLETDGDRDRYELLSEALRLRAVLGDSRVGPDAPNRRENEDLARWYGFWFERTHPGASAMSIRTAGAIARGLLQVSRDHALDFVRKLGYSKRIRG